MAYPVQYLDEVAGMVLLDSMNPDAFAAHEGLIEDAATFEPSVVRILDVVRSVRAGEPVAAR